MDWKGGGGRALGERLRLRIVAQLKDHTPGWLGVALTIKEILPVVLLILRRLANFQPAGNS